MCTQKVAHFINFNSNTILKQSIRFNHYQPSILFISETVYNSLLLPEEQDIKGQYILCVVAITIYILSMEHVWQNARRDYCELLSVRY